MPNLIHSFDSSLVTSTILKLSFDCLTIHDCFGSHPNDMYNLRHEVIKTFVDMYLDNKYLYQFHQNN
jgi:DNA-directed RNA polymerase